MGRAFRCKVLNLAGYKIGTICVYVCACVRAHIFVSFVNK
jgi:hypothetical protein